MRTSSVPRRLLSISSVALALLIGCDPQTNADEKTPVPEAPSQERSSLESRPQDESGRGTDPLPDTVSPYFPMDIGNTWTYDSEGGPDVIFEIVGTEVIDGTSCHKVNRTIDEEVIPFYLSLTPEGLTIHKVGKDIYDPPFLEFALPLSHKDTRERSWKGMIGANAYEIASRNLGKDIVTLPTGDQVAIRVRGRLRLR